MPLLKINKPGSKFVFRKYEYITPCIIDVSLSELDILKKILKDAGITMFQLTDDSSLVPSHFSPNHNEVNIYLNKKLNYHTDNPDNRDYKLQTLVDPKLLQLPTKVDYTEEMSPVKDQGMLGSCVAFSVAAMKEWQESKEVLEESIERTGVPVHKIYDYSEQWIYYKCKQIDPWPNEEGTSLRYALKVLQKVGVPCEKSWPYDDINISKPEGWAKLIALWGLGGEYWRITNVIELESALQQFGPVPIGVPVFYEMFYPTREGIINYPANPYYYYGGHAICVIGYDREKQLFKFKNSWGTGWGKQGYGYLSYKYINDFLWDAWVMKDINVTKEHVREALDSYDIKFGHYK